MAKKTFTDGELLALYSEKQAQGVYWNGSYQEFNGLDVKNPQNMYFIDEAKFNETNKNKQKAD